MSPIGATGCQRGAGYGATTSNTNGAVSTVPSRCTCTQAFQIPGDGNSVLNLTSGPAGLPAAGGAPSGWLCTKRFLSALIAPPPAPRTRW